MFELLYNPRTRCYCVYNVKEDHRFKFSNNLEIALQEQIKGLPFTYAKYVVLDRKNHREYLDCTLTHDEIVQQYPEYFI